MEMHKAAQRALYAMPDRFRSFPAALEDWSAAQRGEFQVWWAQLPYGAGVDMGEGNLPAIHELNRQLLEQYPRPA